MNREQWDALSGDSKREWAEQNGTGRPCIDCHAAPAGTPWGAHWCASCDEQRLDRIDRNLRALAYELRNR